MKKYRGYLLTKTRYMRFLAVQNRLLGVSYAGYKTIEVYEDDSAGKGDSQEGSQQAPEENNEVPVENNEEPAEEQAEEPPAEE